MTTDATNALIGMVPTVAAVGVLDSASRIGRPRSGLRIAKHVKRSNMAKKKRYTKINIIKKGTPLPGEPAMKFDSAHLTKTAARKRVKKLLNTPGVGDTLIKNLPSQHWVFRKNVKNWNRW